MKMKINWFLAIFFLFCTITIFVLPSSIFASQPTEKCIQTRWFATCIPIPPKPTIPPLPSLRPRPTPSPTPLVIGANLKEYKKPARKNCDLKVPSQYSTIQSAIDVAIAGDIICVAKGTYNEDVRINKSVTLAGSGANNTSTINGQAPGYGGAVRIEADNATVEGFVIKGAGSDYTNAALHIAESHSNVKVQYNHIIAGASGLSLLTDGWQNNHLIQNNILEGNNSPHIAFVNGIPTTAKASNNVNFLKNTFIGTVNHTPRSDSGIVLVNHATNSSIQQNVFNTSESATMLVGVLGPATVNYNNFNSPTTIKVSGTGVNGEDNWWGDTDPSDNISGDVDYIPFATAPFAEN